MLLSPWAMGPVRYLVRFPQGCKTRWFIHLLNKVVPARALNRYILSGKQLVFFSFCCGWSQLKRLLDGRRKLQSHLFWLYYAQNSKIRGRTPWFRTKRNLQRWTWRLGAGLSWVGARHVNTAGWWVDCFGWWWWAVEGDVSRLWKLSHLYSRKNMKTVNKLLSFLGPRPSQLWRWDEFYDPEGPSNSSAFSLQLLSYFVTTEHSYEPTTREPLSPSSRFSFAGGLPWPITVAIQLDVTAAVDLCIFPVGSLQKNNVSMHASIFLSFTHFEIITASHTYLVNISLVIKWYHVSVPSDVARGTLYAFLCICAHPHARVWAPGVAQP